MAFSYHAPQVERILVGVLYDCVHRYTWVPPPQKTTEHTGNCSVEGDIIDITREFDIIAGLALAVNIIIRAPRYSPLRYWKDKSAARFGLM